MNHEQPWLLLRLLSVAVIVSAIAVTATLAATINYTYDELGRLRTVTYDGGITTTYTLDAAGNRTNVTTGGGSLQAQLSATQWNWYKEGPNPPLVPPAVVVTASGGSGGYTYSWQRVSGDTQTTATTPTSNSTQWSRPSVPLNTLISSVWRCQVTDGASGSTFSANVTVTFFRESGACPTCLSRLRPEAEQAATTGEIG